MNLETLFTLQDTKTLQEARETYGPHKQIGVAAEECTELAKELIKAFRYDDFGDAVKHTKDNVVDEVADVFIVLDHVLKLYSIKERDLIPHISKKMRRLRYWLDNSNSIEFTTKHRTIDTEVTSEREQYPYDAFGDYSGIIEVKDLQPTGKGVYENEFLRLFDTGDSSYRKDAK